MTEEKKASDLQSYTKADVDKMIQEATKAQSTELEKLQKIFDERQTKALKKEDVLKKDEILKVLGLEKDATKDPLELINEKLSGFNKTIEQLQNDIKDKDAKLTLKEKQEKAKELAEKAGYKAKIVKLMNLDAEDLQKELEERAEEFPELKENKTLGGGGNPPEFSSSMVNPYKTESFNLTNQFKLEAANPSLAAKFKAEAGLK
jgi:hypothetical protein